MPEHGQKLVFSAVGLEQGLFGPFSLGGLFGDNADTGYPSGTVMQGEPALVPIAHRAGLSGSVAAEFAVVILPRFQYLSQSSARLLVKRRYDLRDRLADVCCSGQAIHFSELLIDALIAKRGIEHTKADRNGPIDRFQFG